MKVLVIGGTGLTGPHIVRGLADLGHEVTVFHRGQHAVELPSSVHELHGDKSELASHRLEFERLAPDVVLNMTALTREDTELFVETFAGIAGRCVVVSSSDVYLAYGRLHGTEPGPSEPLPLREESRLRQELGLGGADYDKVGVESVLREAAEFPATIIRYPAVYGPGDMQRRFYYHVKRIADNRPEILLRASESAFHWPHVYSRNAGHAVVLAVTSAAALGATYNVAEEQIPTWHERIEQIGRLMGWRGEIAIVPDELVPEELLPEAFLREIPNFQRMPDYRQDYLIDSSRIRSELGYREIAAVDEGLRATIDWILANPPSTTPSNWFDYEAEDELLARSS